MKVLLDTHALLWSLSDDPQLSEAARRIFLDPEHQLFVSMASLWEMTIKISLGKLILAEDWHELVSEQLNTNGIQWLPIEPAHCLRVSRLPFHHRDPFDRMLVSQALEEGMSLLTRDRQLSLYEAPVLW